MRRAIPFLAAAALAASGCGRDCQVDVVNVYWETFTDSTGAPFNCSDPGRNLSIQVFVNGRAQFVDGANNSVPIACIPFPDRSSAEGVGLVDFPPGTYQIEVQAYDNATGRLRYDGQTSTTIQGDTCNLEQRVDVAPAATTGTLTMSVTFAGRATCSPDVQNFFFELVDAQGLPVPNAASVFVPCVDVAGQAPAFTIPDLDFGVTYSFRTLAGTVFDAAAPPTNQRTLYQTCAAPVAFTQAAQAFQVDVPAAGPQACP